MYQIRTLVFTVTLLTSPLLYAHEWCGGADGRYAEEWLQTLQSKKSAITDAKIVDRLLENLPVWLRANEKIGKTVGFSNRVFICNEPGLNAYVSFKSEPIRVHADTVFLMGKNEDAIAALLAHEYAHLSLNHAAEKTAAKNVARDWAIGAGMNVLRNTWDLNRAKDVANTAYRAQMSSFGVKQELDADDLGISLVSKSGYKPNAFYTFANLSKALYGDTVRPFPSHPGLVERAGKGEPRIVDESYDQTTAKLTADNDFDAASTTVKEWVSLLPNSANARYYKALILLQLKKPKALESMEDAFLPTRNPSLRQRDGDANAALLWLCVQLYREGYTVESAWCGETQLKRNETLWARFQKQTFQERVWVGTGSADIAGQVASLNFIRKPDGTKLITNISSTAVEYNIDPSQFTPAWRPIRFKACEGTIDKPCPRQ